MLSSHIPYTIENCNERANVAFYISIKIKDEFNRILKEKYGTTRKHMGYAVDEALKIWIEENKLIK